MSERALTSEELQRVNESFPVRWVPCSERMPDIGQQVLLHTYGPDGQSIWETGWLRDPFFGSKPPCWQVGWDYEDVAVYPHWMPLPKGPEVQG